jgi:SAM-dependent methyltransferase
METGWAFTELVLPSAGRGCNRLAFDAWSPTGAALTVRVVQGGRVSVIYPETPLGPDRSAIRLAVDCQRVERLSIAISGVGIQRTFFTPVRLQRVEDATNWVPFERLGAECIRVAIPPARRVTVSVPYYPRWRIRGTADAVVTGADPRGLLTLTGAPGISTLCLSFPATFRLSRIYLPIVYLLAMTVVGIFVWGTGRPTIRGRALSAIVLLRGLLTAAREVALRRRLAPEQAWDLRARLAPDWYATLTTTGQQSYESAVPDLTEILDGLDRAWLQQAHVLEVGCGPGRLLAHIAPLVTSVSGVDISGEMITLARERLRPWPNVTVAKNDGRTLAAFPDGAFDFVYSVNVFQHIPDRTWIESYMSEIHRVLRSGGQTTIQMDGRGESPLWRLVKSLAGADSWAGTLLTRQELIDLSRRHSFVVVRCAFSQGGIRWRGQGLWLRALKP